jgi:hypothetical protein
MKVNGEILSNENFILVVIGENVHEAGYQIKRRKVATYS